MDGVCLLLRQKHQLFNEGKGCEGGDNQAANSSTNRPDEGAASSSSAASPTRDANRRAFVIPQYQRPGAAWQKTPRGEPTTGGAVWGHGEIHAITALGEAAVCHANTCGEESQWTAAYLGKSPDTTASRQFWATAMDYVNCADQLNGGRCT